MTLIQSIILGIVQGLTEFLPISSSAHLVLVPHFLGWTIPEAQIFPFDVLVQLGTLVAVILYFWSDLMKILKAFFQGLVARKPFEDTNARLGWYLILATIPAGLAGILLKSQVEAAFKDSTSTAIFLFGTAALLILAETLGKRSRALVELKWFDALWVGFFQAVSIFPGISRSGSTIAGGMIRNLDRQSAARFSFLMSIPVMLGAGLVSITDVLKVPDLAGFLPVLGVGFIAALLVGYLSIHWLLNFLNKRSLFIFAAYCILLGAVVLISGAIQNKAKSPVSVPAVASSPTSAKTTNSSTSADQNPLKVAYSSSLAWLQPAMTTCAETVNGLSIVTHTLPAELLNTVENDVVLRWGAPDSLTDFSAVLGSERLAVIVNRENPVVSLPLDLVQKLSTGEITTWGQVLQQCPDCAGSAPGETFSSLPIALNFYSPLEEPQRIFIDGIMGGRPASNSAALLIPDGKAMLESVSSNPGGFGFIPAHALKSSVKEIGIASFDPSTLKKPILALSKTEPTGSAREWLLCLQKVLNP
jgi:undecaprenyl-diphosphatase